MNRIRQECRSHLHADTCDFNENILEQHDVHMRLELLSSRSHRHGIALLRVLMHPHIHCLGRVRGRC